MAAPEVPREQVTMATSDEAEDKEVDVDVEGKGEEQGGEEGDEDLVNKRLVMSGNKAKIIVRKRSDPSRYGSGVHHKRKRLSR
jgi:hypothetical protein